MKPKKDLTYMALGEYIEQRMEQVALDYEKKCNRISDTLKNSYLHEFNVMKSEIKKIHDRLNKDKLTFKVPRRTKEEE